MAAVALRYLGRGWLQGVPARDLAPSDIPGLPVPPTLLVVRRLYAYGPDWPGVSPWRPPARPAYKARRK